MLIIDDIVNAASEADGAVLHRIKILTRNLAEDYQVGHVVLTASDWSTASFLPLWGTSFFKGEPRIQHFFVEDFTGAEALEYLKKSSAKFSDDQINEILDRIGTRPGMLNYISKEYSKRLQVSVTDQSSAQNTDSSSIKSSVLNSIIEKIQLDSSLRVDLFYKESLLEKHFKSIVENLAKKEFGTSCAMGLLASNVEIYSALKRCHILVYNPILAKIKINSKSDYNKLRYYHYNSYN